MTQDELETIKHIFDRYGITDHESSLFSKRGSILSSIRSHIEITGTCKDCVHLGDILSTQSVNQETQYSCTWLRTVVDAHFYCKSMTVKEPTQ